MNTQTQYSLLAALVDEPNANIFDDIVAHIIKYVVSLIAEETSTKERHYDTQTLQTKINEVVGITIPITVIRNSINAITHNNKEEVSIKFIGDKGHLFTIQRAWDAKRTSRVAFRRQKLEESIEQLECSFSHYLNENGYSSTVGIKQFLQANLDEAALYLKGDIPSSLNGEFFYIASFIKKIESENQALYNTICDISWGATIAGLLREDYESILRKRQNRKRVGYYLDTPIVMAILDLSKSSSVTQVKDLLLAIKTNNSIPYIHPLTIQEVNSILQSAINSGNPYLSSELSEAYERRRLKLSDLNRIKASLSTELENKGIIVPSIAKSELEKMQKNCDKRLVSALSQDRGNDRNTSFREIHDISLWEYVSNKSGILDDFQSLESYFVTSNTDLVRFTQRNKSNKRKNCLVRPDDVVLNLWLHGGLSSNLKETMLSSRMTTCFVANDVDTVSRMRSVLNHFEKDNPITEDEASDLYNALTLRPPAVFKEIDNLSMQKDEDLEKQKQRLLSVARDSIRVSEEAKTKTNELLMEQKGIREQIAECKNKIDSRKKELKNSVLSNGWYKILVSKCIAFFLIVIWLYMLFTKGIWELLSLPLGGIVYPLLSPKKLERVWEECKIQSLKKYKEDKLHTLIEKDEMYQGLIAKKESLQEEDNKIEQQLQNKLGKGYCTVKSV